MVSHRLLGRRTRSFLPALTEGARSFSTASSAILRADDLRFDCVTYSQPACMGGSSSARDSNWPSITAVTENEGHTRVIVCSTTEPSLDAKSFHSPSASKPEVAYLTRRTSFTSG